MKLLKPLSRRYELPAVMPHTHTHIQKQGTVIAYIASQAACLFRDKTIVGMNKKKKAADSKGRLPPITTQNSGFHTGIRKIGTQRNGICSLYKGPPMWGRLESVEKALVPIERLELEAHGLMRAFLIIRRRHERRGSSALGNALFSQSQTDIHVSG